MELELTLTQQTPTVVAVTCNGEHSHTFENSTLPIESEEAIRNDSVAYGKVLYQALFPPSTIAGRTLAQIPERLLLVATTDELDAIAWEYLHGPDGFLVLETPFVRGLPSEQRIEAPQLTQPLHIVAVPSNPLSQKLAPLNIDGEWQRLKEVVDDVHAAVTLERTRPATIERLRSLVAGQRHRVVHFMGHGGHDASGAILCFEQENGALDQVSAKQFTTRMGGTVFLVTLNACVSATPGPTHFSNLAKSLVRQKIPYAQGMRVSITDEDALACSRTLYDELARGVPIEEALLQARITLSRSRRPWATGVPVLYTALSRPASGFTHKEGVPVINERQSPMDVLALPRAQGTFQGRIEDLTQLGASLTGDARVRLVTIHGSGGQGKTALARETVERFASAWPGGIFAQSLENLPDRLTFALELARFLRIDTQSITELPEIERHLAARLSQKRTLIVLDNAETLVEAVEAEAYEAIELAQLLRQLPSNTVSLLVTSRRQLGWSQETILELDGLSSEDGAALFKQWAPARVHDIDTSLAQALSNKLKGHPLGLRLLAGAFNENPLSLSALINEYDKQLVQAKDKYAHQDHRHRTLIACIEISVRHLDEHLRTLLGGLWIFRAPFLPNVAALIFDLDTSEGDNVDGEYKAVSLEGVSPTEEHLYALWQRGLLAHETTMIREGTLQFYALLPTTRPYIEQHLKPLHEPQLLASCFSLVYLYLVHYVYDNLDKGAIASSLVRQSHEDFEQAWSYLTELAQGRYLLRWGWILYRQGNTLLGLQRLEQAAEIIQGKDQSLELPTLINLAVAYRGIGQPQRARELYEKALPITREVGDRAGEAKTLSNLGAVYQGIGQPQRARELYEQALPITREVGHRTGEAKILSNLAEVYQGIGQPQRARELCEQALSISREVGDRAGEATTLNGLALVYREIGQPQRARELFERALPIMREVGDRAGEATTLNNLALVCDMIGQMQRARELYEKALPITREVGDRAGEATTLNNLAGVYDGIGQPQRARELYEQALPIMREVGDRVGEAKTLSNLAGVYQRIGQPQRARELFEQALPISREVGDRAGEATTLNNLALVYYRIGQSQRARELCEQALPISREVGDRVGEAAMLTNLGEVHRGIGQPQRARELYEQALPIMREVGDRSGEAATLANLAGVYQGIGQPQRARELYEQALPIMREVGNLAGEAATFNGQAHLLKGMQLYEEAEHAFKRSIALEHECMHVAGKIAGLVGLALLLYQNLHRSQEAIVFMKQAIALLQQTGLPQDAAGDTLEKLLSYLQAMSNGTMHVVQSTAAATLPDNDIRKFVVSTVAAMTAMLEYRSQWREIVADELQRAQQQGTDGYEVEFFTAILAILDGQPPTLPPTHLYAAAIAAIQEDIARGGLGEEDNKKKGTPS